MEYVVAVVALLVAVWAVVDSHLTLQRVRESTKEIRWRVRCLEDVYHTDEDRLSSLEERVSKVEDGFILATAPLSVEPWPPGVLRTTSGKRPEVRNIDKKEEQ